MTSPGVPPYIKSDYERKHGVIRILSLFAPPWGVRSPEAEREDSDSTSGLPCAANSARPFGTNGKVEQQVGGLKVRLSGQLVPSQTRTFGPFRTRYELCSDRKLSSSAPTSLSSWRFRDQSEEACGAHLGVNATCQVRLV